MDRQVRLASPAPARSRGNASGHHPVRRADGRQGASGELPGLREFLDEYESERFEFTPANLRVAEATIRVFTGWYPALLGPWLRRVTIAMFDDPLREALGLPPQPRWLTDVLETGLRLRALALRLFFPPRPRSCPYLHDARTYPFGYSLSGLGPDRLRQRSETG